MTPFQTFAKLVNAKHAWLSKHHEMYVAGEPAPPPPKVEAKGKKAKGEAKAEAMEAERAPHPFAAAYLASFPPGTDPIYKTNTEHDCSCCKNFVRHLGNTVAIVDGRVLTVWDVEGAPAPYDEVAHRMAEFTRSQPITSLFRSNQKSYGSEQSLQKLPDGKAKRWNHFHGEVGSKQHHAAPDAEIGKHRSGLQVFGRGLDQLKPEALDEVVSMIEENALYRGAEHLESVKAFRDAQRKWLSLDGGGRSLFVWANATKGFAFFRNTVIGGLVVDLSEGVDTEQAVASFEKKVAPENYKRPKAVITKSMVADAMKTIGELGLESALERRFARISDVGVKDVLWVNNTTRGRMKGGLEGLLMDAVTQAPPSDKNAIPITIAEFMERVLPRATDVEMLVRNLHQGNLVSLTAPQHPDGGRLFKWGNDFGWSYNGNIADSAIRTAVQARGGRVDGVFRFSHSWNYDKRNCSLMDLHVFMPGCTTIRDDNPTNDVYGNASRVGWNHRNHPASGGVQDVDYTDAAPVGYVPVENITFPSLARMPEGRYICKVHNWALRAPTEGGFRAEIEFGGQVFAYECTRPLKNKEWVTVAVVTLKDGAFTIEHKMPSSTSSQDAWGVKTETLVRVNAVMHSPNHWEGDSVGNKHWFFVLDGCRNPEPARGIYNEFLSPALEKHRRVFEVLGDRTKCQPTDDQLSGLGFSSTRGDTVVTVRVAQPGSTRLYNVSFDTPKQATNTNTKTDEQPKQQHQPV